MRSSSHLVYSLGTSTRHVNEFVQLLHYYNIEQVIDIRRFPTSRFEHFQQQKLKDLLDMLGICYLYLGDKLGGYRHEGYQAFARTNEFMLAITELEQAISRRRSTILCAEKLPWKCHRRFVTAELSKRGWKVQHIIDRDKLWSEETERHSQGRPLI